MVAMETQKDRLECRRRTPLSTDFTGLIEALAQLGELIVAVGQSMSPVGNEIRTSQTLMPKAPGRNIRGPLSTSDEIGVCSPKSLLHSSTAGVNLTEASTGLRASLVGCLTVFRIITQIVLHLIGLRSSVSLGSTRGFPERELNNERHPAH